jgi:putative membrane protein insertion efficiency factor
MCSQSDTSSAAPRVRRPLARLIHCVYKALLSPLFGNACRFYPSCSDYALEALERYGWIRGTWMALRRLARCQPWSSGGDDPVP